MIKFERFTLENGLRVIVHHDPSTPLVALNLLYDVGARDEEMDKTGFAHLFEHLMFGGSRNIPSYDQPLQRVGGDNNAFTNNDITNYYLTLPKNNIETGFWLESDRMLELAFSEKSLEVQRNVVIEEFKQRYLNQPYGDIWLELRPLAYQVHPYQWPTIGKEIAHIENATMEDVKSFFYTHYRPNNAVLVVAGDVSVDLVKRLSEKWFGPIPRGTERKRDIPQEPAQQESRMKSVERNVPQSAIYKTWHMQERTHNAYYATDLISDILSRGRSTRLYQELVRKRRLFTEISAYVTGSFDPGMLAVSGKLVPGIKMEEAEAAIDEQMQRLCTEDVGDTELQKVKNKIEASMAFGEMAVLDKAMNLAMAEVLGDANRVNEEMNCYAAVTPADIRTQAQQVIRPENSSVLHYHSSN